MTGATPHWRATRSYPDRRPKSRIPDEVAGRIRQKIMIGALRPGDHLHLERVAEELGISVTPVREALLALRGEGFVDLEPRRGFTVAPLHRADIEDIYQIQAALAGELAARAAEVIEEEQLAELTIVESEARRMPPTGPEAADLDARFHDTINDIASSTKLTWFLGLANRYAPQRFAEAVRGWPEASADDHLEILCALRERDPAAARRAARTHVTRAGVMLVQQLEDQGFWSANG